MRRSFTVFLMVLSAFLCLFATDYDSKFREIGFVDVQELDSTIVVNLRYAGVDNFMGVNMYGGLCRAYMHPEIAHRLVMAQNFLKSKNPAYSLVVYDAARPLSVQRIMYEKVQDTKYSQYVASPENGGGHHNYGCAVDVSILCDGRELDMGSAFDSFSELSHTDNEEANLASGLLSQEAYRNRLLLRDVMTRAGFDVEPCEWWHFSCYEKEYIRRNFKLLDF